MASLVIAAALYATGAVAQEKPSHDDWAIFIPTERGPMRLYSFVATGSQADLDRLQKFAEATPFFYKQWDEPDHRELMVMFNKKADIGVSMGLLNRARGSDFVSLKIEEMVGPFPGQAMSPPAQKAGAP